MSSSTRRYSKARFAVHEIPDMSSDDDSSADEATHQKLLSAGDGNIQAPGMGKKRKKRKQTAKARGPTAMSAARGTGFEEYFADPPITPAEAEEERMDIYAPDIPFEERIQSCIQRFRSRRRLSTQLAYYFKEYLFLGGVDSSPNAYSGIDQRELKSLTPAERRDITAIDGLHMGSENGRFYNGDENSWSVDFTAIAQGFLSVSAVLLTGLEEKPLEVCVGVVENFLRYVLQHDVCPEYEEDVRGALNVCCKAREEWPLIKKLQALMPGMLNDAAAELLRFRDGDDWAKVKLPDDESTEDEEEEYRVSAKATVFTAFALLEGEEVTFQKLLQAWATGKMDTRIFDCAIKLQSVQRASEDIHNRFARFQIDEGHVPAIGRAVFVPTTIKDGWDKPDLGALAPKLPEEITICLDDCILKHLVPGMRMTATLVEVVEVGIYFLKKAGPVLPSFYKFLPQELMKRYKEPQETDRPAPSIHDHERELAEMKAIEAAVKEEARPKVATESDQKNEPDSRDG